MCLLWFQLLNRWGKQLDKAKHNICRNHLQYFLDCSNHKYQDFLTFTCCCLDTLLLLNFLWTCLWNKKALSLWHLCYVPGTVGGCGCGWQWHIRQWAVLRLRNRKIKLPKDSYQRRGKGGCPSVAKTCVFTLQTYFHPFANGVSFF